MTDCLIHWWWPPLARNNIKPHSRRMNGTLYFWLHTDPEITTWSAHVARLRTLFSPNARANGRYARFVCVPSNKETGTSATYHLLGSFKRGSDNGFAARNLIYFEFFAGFLDMCSTYLALVCLSLEILKVSRADFAIERFASLDQNETIMQIRSWLIVGLRLSNEFKFSLSASIFPGSSEHGHRH